MKQMKMPHMMSKAQMAKMMGKKKGKRGKKA